MTGEVAVFSFQARDLLLEFEDLPGDDAGGCARCGGLRSARFIPFIADGRPPQQQRGNHRAGQEQHAADGERDGVAVDCRSGSQSRGWRQMAGHVARHG